MLATRFERGRERGNTRYQMGYIGIMLQQAFDSRETSGDEGGSSRVQKNDKQVDKFRVEMR